MAHQYYYSRLVWLTGDPNERADLFDQITVSQGGGTLLDFIDNRPIEVLGHAVAFPVIEEYWNTISGNHGAWLKELLKPPRDAVSEALLTIPTRGVFAEAKLGHCNSCEEIDDTRYWQWQESPCPCDAPDISDVSPGPRGEAPKVDQSTMPSPVVNIVNPAAAPDPTGLAGALKLLGTSNIFRDMSMATELGSLLNTLAQQSAGLLKPAEASKNDAKSTGASGQATGGGDAGKQTSARQPTVTPRTGQTTDKLIKATGASQATKSQALDQNVRNMVGLPTPLEAPRHFNFDVKWWQGGPDMSATFEVIVKDHNNIEYPLGPYTVLDGLFSATLPDALWQGYTDAGSISGVRLIARDAVCPARSLKLDLPALATDKPAIQFTQPLSIPVVQQSMFTAPQLVGKTNAISKAAGNPLRFSAVAARKEVQISVKATLQGTGELMLEAATNIAGKIAEVIGLQAGVTDTLSGELALGLALKGAPKIAVGASGEVQLPITVEYLDHTTLNLTPVIDSK